MIEIKGEYNSAIIYSDKGEEKAKEQIKNLCDQKFAQGSKIRIMPDFHAGKGCTIGTTMTIQDKVVPNLVGVDVGCGILVTLLKQKHIDLDALDSFIYEHIPSGFNIRVEEHYLNEGIDLSLFRCKDHINLERARLSIGTLGGGKK